MGSAEEIAARRAAREQYATEALAADSRAHVDQHGTPADLPAPDSTNDASPPNSGGTRPAWAGRRGSGGR